MADLAVELLGLRFPNPILAGAGPQTDGAAAVAGALDGGAGGVVARTVLAAPGPPPPEPSVVPYGSEGLLTGQRHSARPAADWLAADYPQATLAARQKGVPFIASLGGPADAVRTLGPQLAAAGAQALEYNTALLPWDQALAALQALRAAVALPVIAKLTLAHGEDLADRAAAAAPHADAFTCMGGFGPVLDLDVDAGGAPRLGTPLGYGTLGGAPVHTIAVRAVFEVARRVHKPVLAAGGAMSPRAVVEFLEVGASLVQVTTAAILRGPGVYGALAAGLDAWLSERGHAGPAAVQGLYLRRFGHGQRVVTTAEEAPLLLADLCVKCGLCQEVCYYDAILAPRNHLPVIYPHLCFQCGLCVTACPTDALRFRPRDQVTMLAPPGGNPP